MSGEMNSDELVRFAFHCRRSIIAPDWRAVISDRSAKEGRLSVAKRVGAPDKRYAGPNERVSRQAEHYLLKSQAECDPATCYIGRKAITPDAKGPVIKPGSGFVVGRSPLVPFSTKERISLSFSLSLSPPHSGAPLLKAAERILGRRTLR